MVRTLCVRLKTGPDQHSAGLTACNGIAGSVHHFSKDPATHRIFVGSFAWSFSRLFGKLAEENRSLAADEDDDARLREPSDAPGFHGGGQHERQPGAPSMLYTRIYTYIYIDMYKIRYKQPLPSRTPLRVCLYCKCQ